MTERHGGTLKRIIRRILDECDDERNAVITAGTTAKKDMTTRHGHAPIEWALGRKPHLPGDILGDEMPLAAMDLIDKDERFAEKIKLQEAARHAVEAGRSRDAISRALNHRSRPTRGPFQKGDTVYFW